MDIVLIAVLVILTTMLFLARRNPLVIVGRLIRVITTPLRMLARALGMGSRMAGGKPSVSKPNFLISFGRPFNSATLTDRMMERVALYSNCGINRTRGLLFEWLEPDENTVPEHGNEDFHKSAIYNLTFAKHFFHFDIPVDEVLKGNLHEYLYEDVHSALIVNLFGGSQMTDDERKALKGKTVTVTPGIGDVDAMSEEVAEDVAEAEGIADDPTRDHVVSGGPDDVFYYVVSEMRKTINANIRMLATYLSLIVVVTFLINVYAAAGTGIADGMPTLLPGFGENAATFGIPYLLEMSEADMKLSVFGALTCLIAFMVMSLLYVATYKPYQNYNSIQLNQYIIRYFAYLSVDFNRSRTEAISVIGASDRPSRRGGDEESDVDNDKLSKDSQLYFINLQWTAFRVFFMEWFLRGVFYQVMRNASYYLVFIPLAFACAILLGIWIASNGTVDPEKISWFTEFGQKFLDFANIANMPTAVYIFIAILFIAYYRYLTGSVQYIQRSIRERDWQQFHRLGLENAMSDVIKRYVVEIRRWQFKFGGV